MNDFTKLKDPKDLTLMDKVLWIPLFIVAVIANFSMLVQVVVGWFLLTVVGGTITYLLTKDKK